MVVVNYKALGVRIRAKRKERHITQSALAEMADISLSFLGHIERGSRKASLETIIALCNALHVSPTYLLQESLDRDAMGENHASRKEIIQELSMSVIERLREWDGEA